MSEFITEGVLDDTLGTESVTHDGVSNLSQFKYQYSWFFLPQEQAAFNPNFKLNEMLERGNEGWRYVEDEEYILEGVLGKLLWFEREVVSDESGADEVIVSRTDDNDGDGS